MNLALIGMPTRISLFTRFNGSSQPNTQRYYVDFQSRSLLPEHILYDIRDDGFARCASFNRRATLLAAGCSDGRVVVYDFATRGIVKIFVGHVQPVTIVWYAPRQFTLLHVAFERLLTT
jgi:WD40 repeat protein